ncbi:MAG: YdcF family protein [Verrucomicrobiota bacterium]
MSDDNDAAAAEIQRKLEPRKRRSCLGCLSVFIIVPFVLLLVGWIFHPQLLSAAGRSWIKNEAQDSADAILVLGGGVETRPFRAAELYNEGVATKMGVLDPKPMPTSELGFNPDHTDLTLKILGAKGVPESAIEVIGDNVDSTWDEVEAVRAWIESQPDSERIQSVLIPTDPFHTRRVDWLFEKQLADFNVEIYVVPVVPPNYRPEDWWKSEGGVIRFQNELIKYVFYRINY